VTSQLDQLALLTYISRVDIAIGQQQKPTTATAPSDRLPIRTNHRSRASNHSRPVYLFQSHLRCFNKKSPFSSVPYAAFNITHASKRPLFRAIHDFVINDFLPSVALAKDGVSPLPRISRISWLQIQEIHISPGFSLNQLAINHLSTVSPLCNSDPSSKIVPNRAIFL
jgi:hypothetical protein